MIRSIAAFALLPLLTTVTSAQVLSPAVERSDRTHVAVEVGPYVTEAAFSGTDSADVARVVTAFHAALASGDSTAALQLLAPDAVIHESGSVETRSDYAQHHLPGDIQFARAIPSERSAVRVVVAGDVAWTSGTSTTRGTYKDRVINSIGAESMVLSRASGAWRIRAIHWSSRTARS